MGAFERLRRSRGLFLVGSFFKLERQTIALALGLVMLSSLGLWARLVKGDVAINYTLIFPILLLLLAIELTLDLRSEQTDREFSVFLNLLLLSALLFLTSNIFRASSHFLLGTQSSGFEQPPAETQLISMAATLVVIVMVVRAFYVSRTYVSGSDVKAALVLTGLFLGLLLIPLALTYRTVGFKASEVPFFLVFFVLATVILFFSLVLIRLYQRKALETYWLMLIVAVIVGLLSVVVGFIEIAFDAYFMGGLSDTLTSLIFASVLVGQYHLLKSQSPLLTYNEIVKQFELSERRYKFLVEQSNDPIYNIKEGRLTFVNRAFAELFGLSKEEAMAENFSFMELVHPDSKEFIIERGKEDIARQHDHSLYEFKGLSREGQVFDLEANISYFIDEQGDRVIQGILRDITERKLAEEQIRTQREYYQALFSRSPVAIVSLDLEERVVDINPRFTAIFGFSEEEVKGRTIDELLVPERLEEEARDITRRSFEGDISHHETQRLRKDGTIVEVAISGAPIIIDNEQVGVFGLYEDITERRQAEEELKATNEELAGFVYTASHDLKAPIVSMSGFLGLLSELEGENLSGQGKQIIGRMEEASRQMRRLLEDLTIYTKMGHNHIAREPLELDQLLAELRKEFGERLAESGACLLLPKPLPRVLGDEEGLRHVFVNLLSNALNYMGEQRVPKVELDWVQEGDYCHLKVMDNGIGIDPAYHDKIFEPFQVLKDRRGGRVSSSGLGLSIVKRIAEGHGGRIWVESDGVSGSTFHLLLPLADRKEEIQAEITALMPIAGVRH